VAKSDPEVVFLDPPVKTGRLITENGGKFANSEQVKKFMQPRLMRQVPPIFLDLPPGRQEFPTPGVGATGGTIVGTLHFCNVRRVWLPLRLARSLVWKTFGGDPSPAENGGVFFCRITVPT
jgi:hypothetical protein